MSMQHKIQAEWNALADHFFSHRDFMVEAVGAAKTRIGFLVAALEADLQVIEAGLLVGSDAFMRQAKRRSDQVAVETHPVAFAHKFFHILAYEWLAARKAQLHGT